MAKKPATKATDPAEDEAYANSPPLAPLFRDGIAKRAFPLMHNGHVLHYVEGKKFTADPGLYEAIVSNDPDGELVEWSDADTASV